MTATPVLAVLTASMRGLSRTQGDTETRLRTNPFSKSVFYTAPRQFHTALADQRDRLVDEEMKQESER